MENLEAFMIEEKEEIVDYIASSKFKDKEGNPVPWKIKSITAFPLILSPFAILITSPPSSNAPIFWMW